MYFEGNFQSHDTVSFHVNCFWRDVLIAWSFYKYYNPVKLKEIVSQSIWNNSFIKIDGQIIFFRRWFDQGVKYITDILTENGNFKLFIDMQSEFNLNANQFMRYYAIVCAIKSKWKNIFSQGNLNYPCDDHKLQLFLSKKQPTKFCYSMLVSNVCLNLINTKHLNKWESDLSMNLETLIQWQDRFKRIYKATLDTKIRTFQFKFIHRRIATNKFLYRIGVKSSPTCNFCRHESQDLMHLFFHCSAVKTFWTEVNKWLFELDAFVSSLSILDICFGVNSRNDFVNTIIFYGKHFIYRYKYIEKILVFNHFQKEIIFLEKVERIIALRQGKISVHLEKWKVLI